MSVCCVLFMFKANIYTKLLPPTGDRITAICEVICLASFFCTIALILFVSTKGIPFFFRTRLGKNRKWVRIFRFNAINDARDQKSILLPDEKRLTKFGNLLRETSRDGLLQLLNIIRVGMSLVSSHPSIPGTINSFFKFFLSTLYRGRNYQPSIITP